MAGRRSPWDRGPGGPERAFTAIAAEPMGRVMLWVVVAGLAAVVLWRAPVAVRGVGVGGQPRVPDLEADRPPGSRWSTPHLKPPPRRRRSRAHFVRGRPGGRRSAGAAGQSGADRRGGGRRTGRRREHDQERLAEAVHRGPGPSSRRAWWTRWLNARTGQVGFIAKCGVAIGVVGVLLVSAALTYDPQRANGLDAAFKDAA
ncbi:DUF1206 domain-containing protein [Pseudonocardia sp. MCCB 268]|nr:DUF1206 domain-containing protein [Pseudonocardia cytotoxica]